MTAAATRAGAAAGALLIGAGIVAGCASDPSGATPRPAAAVADPGTTAATPPEVAAAETAAAAPVADTDRCTTRELSVNDGKSQGSAGSVTIPLVFTNTGGRTCTLDGFPGVSYVDGEDGREVGRAATRSGEGGAPVVLAPGARATAMVRAVQVLDYPAQECVPTPVAGLRVYPPNDTATLFVGHAGTGCATYDVNQLQVTAVAAR
ncbi:DUF4232 domain-containing protein [Rhodococcus sp. NPDC058505]|uniref:DUF4232 domain-containing protein n=1 Tax=unclassified Rhodococcus (in: high G+C Gram-positive bacteria) TaxID=192944 RepID=UPI00365382C3